MTTAPTDMWQYLQKLLICPKRATTPTILQMEAVECGAAALGIILAYYGKIVPLPELRRECGVSRDGSKASNMLKAGRHYGLEARGFKKELDQLQDLRFPYIVFWNFNHFLVVEGFSNRRVYLNDPANGRRSIPLEEFDSGYTGVVLTMQPSFEFTKGGYKTNILTSLWQRLQGATAAILYCIIAGFFLAIIGLAVPVFSQVFVDEILVKGQHHWIRPLLVGLVVIAIVQGWLVQLRLRHLRRLKSKLCVGMSSRFLWHILRLPISFYDQRFSGEISDRTNLNDEVADALSGKVATTVIDSVMVCFYTLVMFQYDWLLSLVIVSFAAINFLTLQWIGRQRVDANQLLQQEQGKASGASIAALQGIETLKASGLESDFFSKWSGYYTKAINSQQDLESINQILSALPRLLSALSSMLLIVFGGWRVMSGHMSIGMLVAFQGLVQNFESPINNLVGFSKTLQELESNLIRLDDILCNPIDSQVEQRNLSLEQEQGKQSQLSPYSVRPKLQGYVELRNVTFGFNHLESPLIENFNLVIKPGQRVALVGTSGSGKSTIAKLVSGLYQPWSGEILFDNSVCQQHHILTNSISLVEQEILLFSGTVRDNLTLWDTTVSEKNIIRACKDAAIDDVVCAMSGGYDAELIENAANLSGGQRQRLEIARALVNNPSILIMDEATSALDTETEKIIDENLRKRGCSCLIVAHRLSTIRDCDQIIVLEHGKVVQQGTHEQLWQLDGAYSSLIRTEGEALSKEEL
ncbi:NHLP family bacteriocin export ABC transporter peptidase/permease/ATPase [Dulcicalothrix desertica PCC 7102]|uniref:NHLP family bacteriocin export ABC transporter peptidase/permease/ATPase n=2 Tax=Dulcicalothrix desertica TaxID=32056 RepID=A0A433VRR3_9CYAN|nr:NHLP family bacteriocin export ABC transporter peptidase/permease/ATPase [Dulcicalothrix desertica PCC 7102]